MIISLQQEGLVPGAEPFLILGAAHSVYDIPDEFRGAALCHDYVGPFVMLHMGFEDGGAGFSHCSSRAKHGTGFTPSHATRYLVTFLSLDKQYMDIYMMKM